MTASFDSIRQALSTFGLDDTAGRLQLCFGPDATPDAQSAAVIVGVPHATLERLSAALANRYPPAHPVRLALPPETQVEPATVPLGALAAVPTFAGVTALYVPALHPEEDMRDFAGLVAIIRHLRDPESGCPWDNAQTHGTLKRYLLEEAYETLGALDAEDPAALREELGDLLLQIVLHARIAEQAGEFELRDVIEGLNRKLLRRHPHVFGEVAADTADEVAQNWESLKRAEKQGLGEDQSALGGIPKSMPALAYSQGVLGRAERAGFKWPARRDILSKVAEEAEEIGTAKDGTARQEKFGDLLFALVSLARSMDIEAEDAIRMAAAKFTDRFQEMERQARNRGVALDALGEGGLRELWMTVKAGEDAHA